MTQCQRNIQEYRSNGKRIKTNIYLMYANILIIYMRKIKTHSTISAFLIFK